MSFNEASGWGYMNSDPNRGQKIADVQSYMTNKQTLGQDPGNWGTGIEGASFNNKTGQYRSADGTDITAAVTGYLAHREAQRQSGGNYLDYIKAAQAAPGRKQTILTTDKKGPVLGDLNMPVLG